MAPSLSRWAGLWRAGMWEELADEMSNASKGDVAPGMFRLTPPWMRKGVAGDQTQVSLGTWMAWTLIEDSAEADEGREGSWLALDEALEAGEGPEGPMREARRLGLWNREETWGDGGGCHLAGIFLSKGERRRWAAKAVAQAGEGVKMGTLTQIFLADRESAREMSFFAAPGETLPGALAVIGYPGNYPSGGPEGDVVAEMMTWDGVTPAGLLSELRKKSKGMHVAQWATLVAMLERRELAEKEKAELESCLAAGGGRPGTPGRL